MKKIQRIASIALIATAAITLTACGEKPHTENGSLSYTVNNGHTFTISENIKGENTDSYDRITVICIDDNAFLATESKPDGSSETRTLTRWEEKDSTCK